MRAIALTLLCAAAATALVPARPARAQAPCSQWVAGPLAAPTQGTDGTIYAMTVWDPDGGGPLPPLLIVGGSFSTIDGVSANNIAAWDGLVWRPLGGGTSDTVRALTVYNGNLVVGGKFTIAGGAPAACIASWNGSFWLPIGVGIGQVPDDDVLALVVYNGQLIAGGIFQVPTPDLPPAVSVWGIARWDGSTWRWMSESQPLLVDAFAVFNNVLYVGGVETYPSNPHRPGYYGYLAAFDGSRFSYIGDVTGEEPQHWVFAMTVYNGLLFVGGLDGVRRYAGGSDWKTVGSMGQGARAFMATGYALFAACDSVIDCNGCGGVVNRVARWTGSYDQSNAWAPLGSGIGPPSYLPYASVATLAEYNGLVMAGGKFNAAGGVSAYNLAQWNGVGWSVPAAPTRVMALATYGSKVAIGGYLSQSTPAGEAYYLTAWDGLNLTPVGSGMDAPVFALKGYTDSSYLNNIHLVAGGTFNHVGGIATSCVAMWTESTIFPFNTWSAMGSGFNSTVLALERFNGNIVAGGVFLSSGPTATTRVAWWDGSAWQPMGLGMNGAVRAFKPYLANVTTTVLLAGGDFTSAGGGPANRIAQWVVRGGLVAQWGPVGGGFNGSVYAIERYAGSTYAAGAFTSSGTSSTPLNRIARWDVPSASWVSVGSTPGGGFDDAVYSLKVEGGYLYAAGAFTFVDDHYVYHVARWDGTSWNAAGAGPSDPVLALLPFKGELLAGGEFSSVETNTLPTWGVARFLETGTPWIVEQPVPQTVDPQATATFNLEPAPGYGGLSFAWQRDGLPLSDGLTLQGSTISGSATKNLTISHVALADSGVYTCAVTNSDGIIPCGYATSDQAALVVNNTVGVGPPLPLGAGLRVAIQPNPFRRSAEVTFSLSTAGPIDARIFDASGRIVRRLVESSLSPGQQRVPWDGLNDAGREVEAGLYFVRVHAAGETETRKLLKLR